MYILNNILTRIFFLLCREKVHPLAVQPMVPLIMQLHSPQLRALRVLLSWQLLAH